MEIPGIKESQGRPIAPDQTEKPLKKTSQHKEIEVSSKGFVQKTIDEQEESIKQLAENLNQFMKNLDYNLQFIPDREAGIVIIKVLDGNGKLIRQIPPEAFLSLSSRIGESIGIFINSKL